MPTTFAHAHGDSLLAFLLRRPLIERTRLEERLATLGPGARGTELLEDLLTAGLIEPAWREGLARIAGGAATYGDYVVDSELGKGASGTVLKARHLTTGATVALKVLHREFAANDQILQRFLREVDLLQRIDHPHIARAFDHAVEDGKPWMAMELINGPSLDAMVKEHGALPEPYVLRVLTQVAQGLAHVHQQCNLIHRDLKPGNIIAARAPEAEGEDRNLWTETDIAKIIDFGLAKSTHDDATLTAAGMTMGTPAYMSPEQIEAGELDCRSDIYALGATLYHLLTGATPYSGASPMMVMTAHLTDPVRDPRDRVPGLHPLTARLVTTAMAKKPADRFPSHVAFLNACEQAMEAIGMTGGEGLRLLRKPMVLKGPHTAAIRKSRERKQATTSQTRRPGTETSRRPGTAPVVRPPTTSAGRPAVEPAIGAALERDPTRRLVEKYRQKQQGGPGPQPGELQAVRIAEDAAPADEAGDVSPDLIPDHPITRARPRIEADADIEPMRSGLGMLPWYILGALLVVACLIWLMFAD